MFYPFKISIQYPTIIIPTIYFHELDKFTCIRLLLYSYWNDLKTRFQRRLQSIIFNIGLHI